MESASKRQLYAEITDYEKYQAFYANRKSNEATEKDVERINSDIRNEVERRKKQGYLVTPCDAYHWKRTTTLIEAGPHYLSHVKAYEYRSEPYKTYTMQRIPCTTAAEAITEPALTIDQIMQSSTYIAVKQWLVRQLVSKLPNQVMCASCKASDTGRCHRLPRNECNCRGAQCRCLSWEAPVSISLLERCEHSLTRHRHKRRRTQQASRPTTPVS